MYDIVQSPIFLSALFSWFISQVLKTVIDLFRRDRPQAKSVFARLLWGTGGMPSSHSAVVTSLATSIGFVEGVGSPLFVLALFFAFLTIRDAVGVRRAAGSQAVVLNKLIYDLSRTTDVSVKSVKEIHGHKFSEVSVGALLGFFIAVAFCNL
jgi:hypothetical protein